jgi:hypothetical protein
MGYYIVTALWIIIAIGHVVTTDADISDSAVLLGAFVRWFIVEAPLALILYLFVWWWRYRHRDTNKV